TGPMRHIVTTPIADKTTGELFEELAQLGGRAMVEVLGDLAAYPPVAQDDALATHAPKIDKGEARIDWSRGAEEIERLVRGLAPFPGAWFELEGERIKLLRAEVVEGTGAPGTVLDNDFTIACGTGAIRPVILQRAGKPATRREDFLRGRAVAPGTLLA
ncbi:MAG: methionyl-tRNA formyltransferase, partial [Erythrobacter sp.]|nr:methionyl-tRNA formyltransferase [Erythrobacter sp.]